MVFAFVDVLNNGVGHVADDVGVVARAANQVVDAATAVQCVVARQALQRVVAGVSGQTVVELGATQIFDACVAVAGGFGHILCSAAKRSGHALGGVFIADGVVAFASLQGVRTQATFEHVVTAATLQQVALCVAHQHVVLYCADQVLDVFEGVARSVWPRVVNLLVCAQVHAHTHGRVHIGHGVAAGATVKHVATRAAFEGVITSTTAQAIVFLVAHQGV